MKQKLLPTLNELITGDTVLAYVDWVPMIRLDGSILPPDPELTEEEFLLIKERLKYAQETDESKTTK